MRFFSRFFASSKSATPTGAPPDGAPVARRGPRPWVRYASARGGSTPIGERASPCPQVKSGTVLGPTQTCLKTINQ